MIKLAPWLHCQSLESHYMHLCGFDCIRSNARPVDVREVAPAVVEIAECKLHHAVDNRDRRTQRDNKWLLGKRELCNERDHDVAKRHDCEHRAAHEAMDSVRD